MVKIGIIALHCNVRTSDYNLKSCFTKFEINILQTKIIKYFPRNISKES